MKFYNYIKNKISKLIFEIVLKRITDKKLIDIIIHVQ